MSYSKDVLAVVGAKGGVGKTTTSLNLAAAMAEAGHSVVAVELDIGMANFVDFLDVEVGDDATVHDVLAGDSSIESARYRVADGFFIAPSGTQLTGYANTDLDRLSGVVEALAWYHDAIVLDTPAGVGEEIVRSLQLADEAILVSTPRVASIRNAENTIELTDRIGTDVRGLVLTKSGTGASPGADRIAEFLDVPLLGHVPEDDAVPHSQDRGQPVVDYAPRSGAAIAYRKIAEKLFDDPSSERSTPAADDEGRHGQAESDDGDPSDEGSTDVDDSDFASDDGHPSDEDTPDDSTSSEPLAEPVVTGGCGRDAMVGHAADRTSRAPQSANRGGDDSRNEAAAGNEEPTDDESTQEATDAGLAHHPAASDSGVGDDRVETEEEAERHRRYQDGPTARTESHRPDESPDRYEASGDDGSVEAGINEATGSVDAAGTDGNVGGDGPGGTDSELGEADETGVDDVPGMDDAPDVDDDGGVDDGAAADHEAEVNDAATADDDVGVDHGASEDDETGEDEEGGFDDEGGADEETAADDNPGSNGGEPDSVGGRIRSFLGL